MAEPFLGEIRSFAINKTPDGWAPCDGRLLKITDHQALFALLGTTYGGDGRTSFGLPNLTDRVAVGDGHGQGLTPRNRGDWGGIDALPLTEATLASHRHTLHGTSTSGTSRTPSGSMFASFRMSVYRKAVEGTGTMSPETITPAGEAQPQPHQNLQPSLTLVYCIAVEGVYPPGEGNPDTEVG